MKSKLIARRQPKKVSTVVVSKETMQDAILAAHEVADEMMNKNPNDPQLDKLEEAASFLQSILEKSPSDMQMDGVSTIDEYGDTAVAPQFAQKIKGYVDMIRSMRNANAVPQTLAQAPVQASGSDNFVAPQDAVKDGGEKAEVPRLAAKKTKEADGAVEPAAAPVPPAPAPAPAAAPAAAPAPEAVPSADMTAEQVLEIIPTEMILKIVEDLPKRDDFHANQQLQNALIYLTEVLKTRPVEPEVQEAPAPKAASFGGLKLASPDAGGGNWTSGGKRGDVLEDGGRTPEIGQAHKSVEDNTGIDKPKTDDMSKFASEMTSSKAVKLAEKVGSDLKAMYLEAKPLTAANDTRPVREAVESIYRAYDLMGEATKVLNKQVMQEEAEKAAVEVKEKNKKSSSLFAGLKLAADEE